MVEAAHRPSAPSLRIESLDYMRGLLAVAVMVYHYVSWAGFHPDAGTLLARLGIYAVSTFYILSGLSVSLVYRHGLGGREAVRKYAIHRLFRIVPLFWVVISLSLALQLVPQLINWHGLPALDAWRVFLNFSLLFGFIQPEAYFSAGAWSIGNEMVFYAIFPFLIAAWSRSRGLVVLALVTSLTVGAWITAGITPDLPLSEQWSTYINPFNQLPFFIAGLLIACWGRGETRLDAWLGLLMLAAGVAIVVARGTQGYTSALVTLGNRPYFLIGCVLVVTGVFRANELIVRIPFGGGLARLGAWTYSIYLLHPFPPVVTTRVLGDGWMGYGAAAVGTLALSYLTYRWLELPMMRLGKQVAIGHAARSLSGAAIWSGR